ncbi:MAG TPA: hypothetical protein VHD63_21270 [Ktedonobacteraceae bacterium]|nr:hypothetical protein [Ktedonobacteraceae bacterium]
MNAALTLDFSPAPSTAAQVFSLPGMFPSTTRMWLDPHGGIAFLWRDEPPAPVLLSCHLTPSGVRVLSVLLHAYPQSCSFEQLFRGLYPTGAEPMGSWNPQVGLRPIRRAIWSLLPPMRAFGLTIVSLRNRGYLLTALENVPVASMFKDAHINRWEVSR